MVNFDNVSKHYPGSRAALNNISFNVPVGGMGFITGHSGAGKSTLLKLIAAIEKPNRGTVLVNDINLNTLRRSRIPYLRRQLGLVFQDHQLLYDRSVYDNVALPLLIAGYGKHESGRRVRAALDKVGLLGKEKLNPIVLSGGEQQRVGIARAVVHRPALLLADEPTGNLDPELSWEIMVLFEEFNRVGVTVLVASHDLDLIERMGYPQLVLRNGDLAVDQLSRRE